MQRFLSLSAQTEKGMKHIFILLLLLTIISCKKEDKLNGVVFYKGQTQCADKWMNGTDAETIQNMTNYLLSKGIEVSNARLTDAPIDRVFCAACSCPTGRSYIITVIKGSEEDLRAEGFYR
jgi:hypothetical protein